MRRGTNMAAGWNWSPEAIRQISVCLIHTSRVPLCVCVCVLVYDDDLSIYARPNLWGVLITVCGSAICWVDVSAATVYYTTAIGLEQVGRCAKMVWKWGKLSVLRGALKRHNRGAALHLARAIRWRCAMGNAQRKSLFILSELIAKRSLCASLNSHINRLWLDPSKQEISPRIEDGRAAPVVRWDWVAIYDGTLDDLVAAIV